MTDFLSSLLNLIQSLQAIASAWRRLRQFLATAPFSRKPAPQRRPSQSRSLPTSKSLKSARPSQPDQARRARHLAMEKAMVQLAGSGEAAKALFRSLVQKYPNRGADWYYSKALQILKQREQEAQRSALLRQQPQPSTRAASAKTTSTKTATVPAKTSTTVQPLSPEDPIAIPPSPSDYLIPGIQNLDDVKWAKYLALERQIFELAETPEAARSQFDAIVKQHPNQSPDWLYNQTIQVLKAAKSQVKPADPVSDPTTLAESYQSGVIPPATAPSQPPTPVRSPQPSTAKPPTPVPPPTTTQPVTTVPIPDVIPASLQSHPQPKPPKTHYLFFKVVSLTKNEKTAERLLAAVMQRYPEKDLKWQHEKVIFDLERDRR